MTLQQAVQPGWFDHGFTLQPPAEGPAVHMLGASRPHVRFAHCCAVQFGQCCGGPGAEHDARSQHDVQPGTLSHGWGLQPRSAVPLVQTYGEPLGQWKYMHWAGVHDGQSAVGGAGGDGVAAGCGVAGCGVTG